MRTHAGSAVNDYISSTFVEEDTLLQRVRAKGESLRAGMQVSPVEGKLLYCMARLVGASSILEIGTFVGYSTLWMARALKPLGMITTLEYDADHATLASAFFKESEVVDRFLLLEGKALDTLAILAAEERVYDMVFIDAAKSEYLQYLDLVIPMVRQGGLIIGDNTLLFGAMAGEKPAQVSQKAVESMRAFNTRLADSSLFDSILIPTEEGMTIARKIT